MENATWISQIKFAESQNFIVTPKIRHKLKETARKKKKQDKWNVDKFNIASTT